MTDFCTCQEGGGSPSRIATSAVLSGFGDGKQALTPHGILRHPGAVGKPEIDANPCFGTAPFTPSSNGRAG